MQKHWNVQRFRSTILEKHATFGAFFRATHFKTMQILQLFHVGKKTGSKQEFWILTTATSPVPKIWADGTAQRAFLRQGVTSDGLHVFSQAFCDSIILNT